MPTATDLFAAIDADDARGLETILADAPSLAAAHDDTGIGAVLHALYDGRRSMADRLADALPQLDIFEAAALGRAERVRELVAADPSLALSRSVDGFTALHYAAFFGGTGAIEAARALLDAGADPSVRTDNDLWVLPLHSAAAGGHAEMVELLLAAGAEPDARQRHGWTPLHAAAQNGDVRSFEALLAAGADPEARNDDGRSAGDLARAGGHQEILARLG